MPRKIKAPFNFVPLQDKVFFPEWADQVSQDIPFSDGVSGTIRLTITAETPIMVGGERRDEADGFKHVYFCQAPDGRYYIPGSTIKGTLRSVLEILSYGKMTQVESARFSIRDLHSQFYKDKMTKQDPGTKRTKVHCGWLRQVGDGFVLEDHGLPWRICVEDIDRDLHVGFEDFVKNGAALKDEKNRTALAKYSLFDRNTKHSGLLDNPLLAGRFMVDEEWTENDPGKRILVHFNRNGEAGQIVFTGQPGVRKIGKDRTRQGQPKWGGKYYEFVFPDFVLTTVELGRDEKVMKDFLSVHKNSPDFLNIYKARLNAGQRIPVFFLYDEADKTKVHSIGLSFMYRFPTFNEIHDGIPNELKDKSRHDLAELMFGFADDASLKGRVHCSHAFAVGCVKPMEPVGLILSSPHPSYFPLYVGGGRTWNSGGDFKIAGRKRYPVRQEVWNNFSVGTDDMRTWVSPLPVGTKFEGVVRFHNLRPVELGALLASINFNNHDERRHNIGMAKPMGYGKVRVEAQVDVLQSCEGEVTKETDFIKDFFVREMKSHFPGWEDSSSLRELYAMAGYNIPLSRQEEFTYMQMAMQGPDEFVDGKKAYAEGQQLGLFSQIVEGKVPVAKLVGNVTANEEKQRKELEKQQLAMRQEILKAQEILDKEINEVEQKSGDELIEALADLIKRHKGDKRLEHLLNQAESKKTQALQLANMASEKKNAKRFDEAIELYQQASCLGFDYTTLIEDCKSQLEKVQKMQNASIEDVIAVAPLSSPGAFIGKFKGRTLNDGDLVVMASKIKAGVKPRDIQKKWLNPQQYQKIIGDKAMMLVDLLK